MIQIVKHISVDVASENVFQSIVAKQYDYESRFLKVRLTNEGSQIQVSKQSQVFINALREDGEASAFIGGVNDDGTVTVPITYWMLELDGQVKCDITVINPSAERKLTSTSFTITVEAAAYSGEDITTDPNYDVLVELIAEVNDLKKNIATVDQKYNAKSSNPQSGKAVAEAIAGVSGGGGDVDYSLVANALKGVAVVDSQHNDITIDDLSPFPQELTIKCTRFAWDTFAALIVMDGDQIGTTLYPDEDGYCRGFFADGKPLTFWYDQGDFQIEYNKDTNKAMGDVESALDAIIAMQNQLIGGDSV